MSKKTIIILVAAVLLTVALAGLFCVEYFVLQAPLFDGSGWYTTKEGVVQYRDYYARPLTGWQTIEMKQYYFDETGSLYTGWLDLDGKKYYLSDQGVLHTGWLEEDGNRFYFQPTDGGLITDSWLQLPEGTYLLDEAGNPRTGWVQQEGLRYYFEETGICNAHWQDTAEGLTYLVDGQKHIGWLEVPEGKFYFNDQGLSHAGWVTDEKGRFYLYGDGTFATGFVEVDGVERYFTDTGEYILLCNGWNPIPDDYQMQLVKIGNYKIDASCADAMREMIAAAKADGITLKINNTYRSKNTQQYMWDVRVKKYMAQGMTRAQAKAFIGKSLAVPGTSEHQTGLSVDIMGSQKMYDWLEANSWKYGFILRYPEDKTAVTGIIFEPWHFRYVGKSLAKEIYDSGMCLEEYLEAQKQQ